MTENTGIYASFSIEAVQIPFKSEQEGRPIFEDREFVRIVIAGDRNSEVYREATAIDKERFGEVYDRFKRGMNDREQLVGTPLSQWPAMSPREIKELEGINIFTVEQLASLSDTAKQKFGMGANEYVAKAKAYLDKAKGGAQASAMAAENERLKSDIETLRQQIADLNMRFGEENKRSAGRSAKERRDSVVEAL